VVVARPGKRVCITGGVEEQPSARRRPLARRGEHG
jgi:hypothetical protein